MSNFDTADVKRTLASTYYTSPEVMRQERELFLQTWQLAGHEKQIGKSGDFLTVTIFNQEFFLIHGSDGVVRCFANVCPHRGHRLVSDCGNKGRITCPYHAWTFTHEGKLMGQKKTTTTELPGRNEIGLSEIPVSNIAGFLFINASGDAPPISDFAPGLCKQVEMGVPDIKNYALEDGPALGHSYECRANWKILIDNYLECHHCSTAHESFDDMMDIANSKFELYPNFTYQVAPTALKSETKAFPLDLEHDVTIGQFWFLFPNTVFGQFPGVPGFYASRFDPVSPDVTQRRTWSLTVVKDTDPEMSRRHKLRSEWSSNVVSQEDRKLCESVQRGMHQAAYDQGWYIVDPEAHGISEHAMRHFHQTYLKTLPKKR
jgi:phenylpropionate dioxygenase-like ring-hydroxylating dioxygenase large terminal subunit